MQDSFGDFGKFQSADEGTTTPTVGSWTLTGGGSDVGDEESVNKTRADSSAGTEDAASSSADK